jgi:hypothetical protein
MTNDKKFVIIALSAGITALILMVVFIGQGNVRHVQIFFPEQIQQTIAFQDEEGVTKIVGISGIAGNNPTLIMRTSFAYVLTVVNQGESPHQFYIDGLEIQTSVLEPRKKETITIYPDKEAIYNYYDKMDLSKPLGQLKSVTVIASDEFEGIVKDLI